MNNQLGMPQYARNIANPVDIEDMLGGQQDPYVEARLQALQRWLQEMMGQQEPRASFTPHNEWKEGTHPLLKYIYEEIMKSQSGR